MLRLLSVLACLSLLGVFAAACATNSGEDASPDGSGEARVRGGMGWDAVTAVFADPRDAGRTCFETKKLTENRVDQSPSGSAVIVCYLNDDPTDVTCYAEDRLIGTSVTPGGGSFSESWPPVCDAAIIATAEPAVAVIHGEPPPPGIRYDGASLPETTTPEATETSATKARPSGEELRLALADAAGACARGEESRARSYVAKASIPEDLKAVAAGDNDGSIGLVACADVTGDGEAETLVTIFGGGTAADIAWTVFDQRGGLLLLRTGGNLGLGLDAGDPIESRPVYAPDDPHCCPSALAYVRLHFDGVRFRPVDRWRTSLSAG